VKSANLKGRLEELEDRLGGVIVNLEHRAEDANERRQPGDLNSGTYWNGLYWGVQVALGELLSMKAKIGEGK
jgi:hypothetical protein